MYRLCQVKTRSPGNVIEKSCEHLRATFSAEPSCLALISFFYIGHVGSRTRSQAQYRRKFLLTHLSPHFLANHHESLSNCFLWWYFLYGSYWVDNYVTSSKHRKNLKSYLNILGAIFTSNYHETFLERWYVNSYCISVMFDQNLGHSVKVQKKRHFNN